MPIFEYKCKKCGATFEILLRVDAEKPVCPACGGKRLEKLVSTFAAASKRSSKSGGVRACADESCVAHSCCCGGGRCACGH